MSDGWIFLTIKGFAHCITSPHKIITEVVPSPTSSS
jgi:hypothetical protein